MNPPSKLAATTTNNKAFDAYPAKEDNIDMKDQGLSQRHHCLQGKEMVWTMAYDEKLLLFEMGREVEKPQYEIIAKEFKEKPTAEAVEARLTVLKEEQSAFLKKLGIEDDRAMEVDED
ncbi:hypothetical protein LTR86_003225 [Recurvomyces mirabilis]|nr:hypothetical protein LTR86_003225 [Recurvomyces mirabilis]